MGKETESGRPTRSFKSIGQKCRINLRHLRAFDAAARLGSLNQAGSAVHMSQSSVVYAIKQVEDFFGAALLKRDARGSQLTSSGKLVHARIMTFFAMLETAVASSAARAGGVEHTGSKRIAGALTWQHILAVIGVARLRCVNSVALEFGVSAAVIMQRVRDVERLFDCKLFIRNADLIVPNTMGMELFVKFGVAAKELDYAMDDLAPSIETHLSTISLGCLGFAHTGLLPTTLTHYASKSRPLIIRLIEESFDSMLGQLLSGDLDYLICTRRENMAALGLVGEEIFRTSFAIACRQGHPLTCVDTISPDNLAAFDWVLPKQGSAMRRICEEIFRVAGWPDGAFVETSSAAVSLEILRSSDRLMIATRHDILANVQAGDLAMLSYPLPAAPRPVFVYQRKGFTPPPFHREFIGYLKASGLMMKQRGIKASLT
ncbi:LysR family transcriptional regulator [Agrobacterium leguminum]|uniref:LysR family transcriptional regulator n=1 Tax=Agrobacterium leguminum TaxID=2792015 RepID=UPI003CE5A308